MEKLSLRASQLSDTRAFLSVVHRSVPEPPRPLSELSSELHYVQTCDILSSWSPAQLAEMATKDIVQHMGKVSACLLGFLNSVAHPNGRKLNNAFLYAILSHTSLFSSLYNFVKQIPRLIDTHKLLTENMQGTHSFLLLSASLLRVFTNEAFLAYSDSKELLVPIAREFVYAFSLVLPCYPLSLTGVLQIEAVGTCTELGTLELFNDLFACVFAVSSIFSSHDSLTVQPQFFKLLNTLIVYFMPMWSAESLGHIYTQIAAHVAGVNDALSANMHFTELFPYGLCLGVLRMSLVVYSRWVIFLRTDDIIAMMSAVLSTATNFLTVIQTLINLASVPEISCPPDSIYSMLSPSVFLENVQFSAFSNKLCLTCAQLLDCSIGHVFKPTGFSACVFPSESVQEKPVNHTMTKVDESTFTQAFFHHNGWGVLMQMLNYTGTGVLEDQIEPSVAELLSQITHCADMRWIKEQGYLCTGFSARLAHMLIKSHSRNAKLAAFYTLCNVVIDDGYALIATEPVISACIKNFRSTIVTVVYEANRLLVLLMQTGKQDDKEAYQTMLAHMINQKLAQKLVRSFVSTTQTTLAHQSLPKNVHKLVSMQLKLFMELIECGREHNEFVTPIVDARGELAGAIEEIELRGSSELANACRDLMDFIHM